MQIEEPQIIARDILQTNLMMRGFSPIVFDQLSDDAILRIVAIVEELDARSKDKQK